jgi:hypothetical protein
MTSTSVFVIRDERHRPSGPDEHFDVAVLLSPGRERFDQWLGGLAGTRPGLYYALQLEDPHRSTTCPIRRFVDYGRQVVSHHG